MVLIRGECIVLFYAGIIGADFLKIAVSSQFLESMTSFFSVKPMNTVIKFSKNPVVINETITITCTSEGFPEPIYTLHHNGEVVSTGMPNTISQVKWKNAGRYKCIAANTFGKDSDFKILSVTEERRPTISITRSTLRSSPNTSAKNPIECNNSESNYSETKWYIIVISLVSGIIIGILLSYIVPYSRRKLKSRERQHSNHEPPSPQVDQLTYQELDLKRMNEEDKYQSLTGNAKKNDGVNSDESNYTELNKTRDVENNYQSLS
ncbi:uncharacterized protein LOC114522818 [Dendronephthya gigantea]|uniref:uncharacterized protein LOC114522818 n=1 Tax=Dendronephthya gigantea TaxID=151771 RepID=UPI00106BA286|nr:uncharacterized protein LOC114522818 [Dendronephthya gigantea]